MQRAIISFFHGAMPTEVIISKITLALFFTGSSCVTNLLKLATILHWVDRSRNYVKARQGTVQKSERAVRVLMVDAVKQKALDISINTD